MLDTNYKSMLEDLKSLPKTRNPLKLAQRFLLKAEINDRIKKNCQK